MLSNVRAVVGNIQTHTDKIRSKGTITLLLKHSMHIMFVATTPVIDLLATSAARGCAQSLCMAGRERLIMRSSKQTSRASRPPGPKLLPLKLQIEMNN